MRIGYLTDASIERLDWGKRHGFGSLQWNRFETSAANVESDWQRHADEFGAAAAERGLRISAIGAHYKNPLDPAQGTRVKEIFIRAIDVAARLKIKTVCGFPGAVIELVNNPRGDNPVYKSFENFLPNLFAYWEPIAKYAADQGVRIAFEHCPMGPYHQAIMGFNMLATPAMWQRFFDDKRSANMGIEWDAAHLICQFIEPVINLHMFEGKIFHVHAKDAQINRVLLRRFGIAHPKVAEHRFPGMGEADWNKIVRQLIAGGYDSDLTIEGWHDPVYRDHPISDSPMSGMKLEEQGMLIAKNLLEPLIPKD